MDYRLAWKAKGITLIELMIVVVLIGVLGVAAIPAYRGYAVRAQRTEATSALLRLAANQERFYMQNNTYSNDPGALGFPGNQTETGRYTLAVGSPDFTVSYVAIANLVGADDPDCTVLSLNSQGVRTSLPQPIDQCWGGR